MTNMTIGALGILLLCSTAFAADPSNGKELYASRCSFCHGSDGKGDGPAGSALQPRPTSFADPSFWKSASPEMLRLIIVNGKPGTAMVPFGQTLKGGEVEDLVAYLQTFK